MVRRAAGLALRIIAAILVIAPLSAWSALALSFRLPAPEVLRASAAILFCILGLVTIAALFMRLSRSLVALAVYAVAFAGLLVWWSTITPPLDGDWAPDVARQTTGAVKGDILTLSDVRDFDWRTDNDFTERWEKRSYDLSKLKTLDLFLAYWAGPEMAHVIMSFGFEDGDHIAWSVEVRREKTGVFSPIADAFKNHTLVYLATTERDSVRLRTNVRGEDVRLYRLNTPPGQARALLTEYVVESTALAKHPKWYNSITANCATVVFKLVRAAGSTLPFDWRLVVNGFLPGYLYDHGAVVTTMPLSELMERARVSPQAKAADRSPDFSEAIRVGVPSPWDRGAKVAPVFLIVLFWSRSDAHRARRGPRAVRRSARRGRWRRGRARSHDR